MSPAVVNGLVLSCVALLTLLLAALLIVVLRLPPVPALNPAAEEKLKELLARFADEVRDGADARARVRGRNKISKKDIRAEYRERRVPRVPRIFRRVTPYGGVTISGVGIVIAVRSLPQFPPPSPGVSGAGAVVAAMAMVFDGSEFLRGVAERRRRSKSFIGTPAVLPISDRAEKKLGQCCGRLANGVEKEARRRAGEREITSENIEEAWRKLVKPRMATVPAVPAVRSRKTTILVSLGTLAQLLVAAGILYLIFLLAKAKLPAGQYWPAVVVIAAIFILYLALLNGPRLIAAAWEHRHILGTIIGTTGTLGSGFMAGAAWLVQNGRALTAPARRLFRIGRKGTGRARSDAGKEAPAMTESTSGMDETAGATTANQNPPLPVSSKDQERAVPIGASDQAWVDLAAKLSPANSLTRNDRVTTHATITSIVIGFLVASLGTLAAGQLTHNGIARILAVAAVSTASLAVACALTTQVLALTRPINLADIVRVKAWYHRQLTVRAYAVQATTMLLIAAVLLAGATAATTILAGR